MSKRQATLSTRPVFKPFMRTLWRGIMKVSEAQCEAHARRGYMPHL